MTEAGHAYAQGLAVVATDTNNVTVATIPNTSFTANEKYWILGNGFFRIASSATQAIVELLHGTTPTVFPDGTLSYELTLDTQEANFAFQEFFTQPGTAEQILMRARSGATQDVTVELGQIAAISLTDIGTEGTEYHTHEVTADYTTTATFTDQAAVTFTPNGSDVWLISGWYAVRPLDTAAAIMGRIANNGNEDSSRSHEEGEDTAADNRGRLLMWVGVPTNASHTFSVQFADLGTAGTIFRSNIIAINLTACFAQNAFSFATAEDTPATTPSWTTTRTVAPTPAVTGDWFYWGHYSNDLNSLSNDTKTRLQVNPSGGGLVSDPAYTDSSPAADGWDVTDELPVNIFKLRSLSSGAARDINLDVSIVAGTTQRVEDRALVAFSLDMGATAHALAGVVNASSSVTGNLTVTHTLAGAVNGVSTVTGDLTVSSGQAHALAGVVNASASVTGALTVQHPLAGVVNGVSVVTGDLDVQHSLAGVVAGVSSVSGALSVHHSLAGIVNGASSVSGALSVHHSLAGIVNGVSVVTGDLTVSGGEAHLLAGVVNSISTVSGDLTVSHSLAGIANGVSNVSGALSVAHSLSGVVNGVSVVTGALTVGDEVLVEGELHITVTVLQPSLDVTVLQPGMGVAVLMPTIGVTIEGD